jgi:hypothetical protein
MSSKGYPRTSHRRARIRPAFHAAGRICCGVKRVLLDHCVPRRVATALSNREVKTAFRQGWGTLKNGALLHAAEHAGFEVFVTADKNLRYQPNIAGLQLAIVVLPTNAVQRLLPIFPAIARAVANATPASYVEVPSTP